MNLSAVITALALAGVLGGLVLFRLPAYVPLLLALLALMLTGILEPAEALAGFGNPGLVTVGALFVVAAALRETGVVTRLVQPWLGRPRTARAALLRLVPPVTVLSAFVNNTPVVAVLLPVVGDWSRRIRVPASQLLMPLSYAAILGGLCTLVGTSTNLVVQGVLLSSGREGLGVFEVATVGIPVAAAGTLTLLALAPRLLPAHDDGLRALLDPREYTLEMIVDPSGPFVGRTIEEAGLRHLPGVFLAELHRGRQVRPAVSPDERLEAGDQLVFVGQIQAVVDLRRTPGLLPADEPRFELRQRDNRIFVEAVVSGLCPVVGRTVREGRFRTHYGAAVLGVARQGERIQARIGDIRLKGGDTLLLEAPRDFLERHRHSNEFHLVSRLEDEEPPRHDRAGWALALFVGMFGLVLLGVPLSVAALSGALAMILSGCLSEENARKRVDWPLLLTIGASLGLGRALSRSGLADAAAGGMLVLAQDSRLGALIVLYAGATALSQLVSNAGAAVVAVPVALSVAERLGVAERPFVLAALVASSAAFLTPLGYQTNLMVFGAGGYRMADFLRLGLPLTAICGTVAVTVLWAWAGG
jgi:di/tricarboxylate transporter